MTVEIRGTFYRLIFTEVEMKAIRSQLPQKVFDCITAAEASSDQVADTEL